MRARIKGQMVDVSILREKAGLFGKRYLVEYTTRHRDGAELLYETRDTKWVPEKDLFREENP